MNWQDIKTTLAGIFTVIGAVPQAIESLQLTTIPAWLRTTGLVCSFASFLWLAYNTNKPAKE